MDGTWQILIVLLGLYYLIAALLYWNGEDSSASRSIARFMILGPAHRMLTRPINRRETIGAATVGLVIVILVLLTIYGVIQ